MTNEAVKEVINSGRSTRGGVVKTIQLTDEQVAVLKLAIDDTIDQLDMSELQEVYLLNQINDMLGA